MSILDTCARAMRDSAAWSSFFSEDEARELFAVGLRTFLANIDEGMVKAMHDRLGDDGDVADIFRAAINYALEERG